MSKATGFVMFVLGAAVGSVVTWQYTRKKYEQIAQEEIDSVKEIFSRRESATDVEIISPEPQTAKIGKPEEKPDITEYAARLERDGYTNYSNVGAEQKKEEQARLRRREAALKRTEEEIARKEARQNALNEEMNLDTVATNAGRLSELHRELTELSEELQRLYEEWEELAEE